MTHKRVLIEARTIDGRVIYFDGGIEYDKPDDVYRGESDYSKCLLDRMCGVKSQSAAANKKQSG